MSDPLLLSYKPGISRVLGVVQKKKRAWARSARLPPGVPPWILSLARKSQSQPLHPANQPIQPSPFAIAELPHGGFIPESITPFNPVDYGSWPTCSLRGSIFSLSSLQPFNQPPGSPLTLQQGTEWEKANQWYHGLDSSPSCRADAKAKICRFSATRKFYMQIGDKLVFYQRKRGRPVVVDCEKQCIQVVQGAVLQQHVPPPFHTVAPSALESFDETIRVSADVESRDDPCIVVVLDAGERFRPSA